MDHSDEETNYIRAMELLCNAEAKITNTSFEEIDNIKPFNERILYLIHSLITLIDDLSEGDNESKYSL